MVDLLIAWWIFPWQSVKLPKISKNAGFVFFLEDMEWSNAECWCSYVFFLTWNSCLKCGEMMCFFPNCSYLNLEGHAGVHVGTSERLTRICPSKGACFVGSKVNRSTPMVQRGLTAQIHHLCPLKKINFAWRNPVTSPWSLLKIITLLGKSPFLVGA